MENHMLVSALLSSILLGSGAAQAPAADWLSVNLHNLCVTEGVVDNAPDGRLSVNVPKMRAYINTSTSQSIETRFTYVGPTDRESALGSGKMRRQFGLKLRAQDPCNLVYAMWRIDPKSELVVSVKRNPNSHTSAECGNHGYENIKPQKASAVPRLQPGESHTLRAVLDKEELKIFVDNREVWDGEIGADAAGLNGPLGIRSDNAHLEFDLKAREYTGAHPNYKKACQTGAADSD
jgi:hypothetical protein